MRIVVSGLNVEFVERTLESAKKRAAIKMVERLETLRSAKPSKYPLEVR